MLRRILLAVFALHVLTSGVQAGSLSPLDAAVLSGDIPGAWSQAVALLKLDEPLRSRGLVALEHLSRDFVRCPAPGQGPAFAVPETGLDAMSLWALHDLRRTGAERCRDDDFLARLENRARRVTSWRVRVDAVPTGLSDIFTRMLSWRPPAEAAEEMPLPRWRSRRTVRVLAAAELCVDRDTPVAMRLRTSEPATLWIDGRLSLFREPSSPRGDLHPTGRLVLARGCHELRLGVLARPGAGHVVVEYLPAELPGPPLPGRTELEAMEDEERSSWAWAWLLRGNPALAWTAAGMEPETNPRPLQRLLALRLVQARGSRTAIERLLGEWTTPLLPQGQEPNCLAWRIRLNRLLDEGGDDEIRPWLDRWPEACRSTWAGRLLEIRLARERGWGPETGLAILGLKEELEQKDFGSCRLVGHLRHWSLRSRSTPLNPLEQVPLCMADALAAATRSSDPAVIEAARKLTLRRLARGETTPSGSLRLARRVAASSTRNSADLLRRSSWSEPEALWALADLRQESNLPKIDDPLLGRLSRHELITEDLQSRAAMLGLWQELEEVALPIQEVIATWRGDDFQPDVPMLLVLDELVVHLDAKGAIHQLTTRVHYVKTERGAQQWQDFHLPETGQVLILRVLKQDGSVREPDSLAPGDLVNLEGLEAGDLVVLRHLSLGEQENRIGGGFCLGSFYQVGHGVPVYRSRMVVQNRTELPLTWETTRSVPEPVSRPPAGDLRFNRLRIPAIAQEAAAAVWDAGLPRIDVCLGELRWTALRDRLADRLLGLLTPSPGLRRLARRLTTQPEPIRSAFDYCCRTITPERSLLLLRSAGWSFTERRGDPALVLLALLTEMGVPARIALVDPPGEEERRLDRPTPAPFTQPVLVVNPDPDEPWKELWLDPFGPAARFGALRPFLARRPALVLDTDLPYLWKRTPREPPEAHSVQVDWSVEPDEGGDLTGRMTARFNGLAGSTLMQRLQGASKTHVRQAIAAFAQAFFPASKVISVAGDPKEALFQASVRIPAAQLQAGFLVQVGPASLSRIYASQSRRTQPLLLDGEALTRIRIRLEAGRGSRIRCEGRRSRVEGPFGHHETRCSIDGDSLEIEHERLLNNLVVLPAQYEDLAAFCRDADRLDLLRIKVERK